MASNSIFDTFSSYSPSLLRVLMALDHNGLLTTSISTINALSAQGAREEPARPTFTGTHKPVNFWSQGTLGLSVVAVYMCGPEHEQTSSRRPPPRSRAPKVTESPSMSAPASAGDRRPLGEPPVVDVLADHAGELVRTRTVPNFPARCCRHTGGATKPCRWLLR
ncbi:hypothetical protein cypCar_00028853 [Cyprinus carpio]|nr:hypothetical protein cypCar_00028853 [Cyprinus carpio]